MKRSITLTEDHIKLISRMKTTEFTSSKVGVDMYDLYGGGILYEDMACILGYDKDISYKELNSLDDLPYGEELIMYFQTLDAFIQENIVYIMEIVQQFSGKGGIKPGKYTCDDNVRWWSYADKSEETDGNLKFAQKVNLWCQTIAQMVDSDECTRAEIKNELKLLEEFSGLAICLNNNCENK